MPNAGGEWELPEGEAHHAATVMRTRVGDRVVLFDGRGHQAQAVVTAVSKRVVRCETEGADYVPRDNAIGMWMGVALPKGERAKELVERLTELGVDRLTPLGCERSPWDVSEGTFTKLTRVVIEACKQSGRNRLMRIDPPARCSDWLKGGAVSGVGGEAVVGEGEGMGVGSAWLAHPGGGRIGDLAFSAKGGLGSELSLASSREGERSWVRIAIGPEGGFTDAEVAVGESAGWIKVGLGERIYRIETAAVLLASLVSAIGFVGKGMK
jgi:16S rRNA (uracil1498-N3)-methyltransferase